MIQPELVDELGLQWQKLKMPEIVGVAFSSTTTALTEFVTIYPSSIDFAWTTHADTVAIITPGLCCQLILEILFLKHNNLVTDCSNCTCIDKKSGFNLLNWHEGLRRKPYESKCSDSLAGQFNHIEDKA